MWTVMPPPSVWSVGEPGGSAADNEGGNSSPISRSSLFEKKVTKSVREGVGESTSPSSEEKVGDSGSASGDRSPGKASGGSASWRGGVGSLSGGAKGWR